MTEGGHRVDREWTEGGQREDTGRKYGELRVDRGWRECGQRVDKG